MIVRTDDRRVGCWGLGDLGWSIELTNSRNESNIPTVRFWPEV